MRELYAVEIKSDRGTNAAAAAAIETWLKRHIEGERRDDFQVAEATTDSGMTIWTLDQTNPESDTVWQSELAAAEPKTAAHVTMRVRMGSSSQSIAPVTFEFGSPAIVRTLLRELGCVDGNIEIRADLGDEIGASDIPELVRELLSRQRRLPVVLVTRDNVTGRCVLPPSDLKKLAREVAGLAHVRVLASSQASWELKQALGGLLSVWDGAMRVYFPGFSKESNPYDHRLLFPDMVDDRTIPRLRSWFGTLAAAAIQEHPAHLARRTERRARLAQAVETADVSELKDLLELYETEVDELERDRKNLQADLTGSLEQARMLEAENESLKHALSATEKSRSARSASAQEVTSVDAAMNVLEELAGSEWYRPRVEVTTQALRSGRAFSAYQKPSEMLRALQAVLEAGALYFDDRLGEPPGEFFRRRGFGYGANPSPHLKVDEATSPDQCLRIYWEVNEDTRMWEIKSIGPHR